MRVGSNVDAGGLETDALDVGAPAGRDQDEVALNLLFGAVGVDEVQDHAILGLLDARGARAEMLGDLALLEGALELGARLGVLGRRSGGRASRRS